MCKSLPFSPAGKLLPGSGTISLIIMHNVYSTLVSQCYVFVHIFGEYNTESTMTQITFLLQLCWTQWKLVPVPMTEGISYGRSWWGVLSMMIIFIDICSSSCEGGKYMQALQSGTDKASSNWPCKLFDFRTADFDEEPLFWREESTLDCVQDKWLWTDANRAL